MQTPHVNVSLEKVVNTIVKYVKIQVYKCQSVKFMSKYSKIMSKCKINVKIQENKCQKSIVNYICIKIMGIHKNKIVPNMYMYQVSFKTSGLAQEVSYIAPALSVCALLLLLQARQQRVFAFSKMTITITLALLHSFFFFFLRIMTSPLQQHSLSVK